MVRSSEPGVTCSVVSRETDTHIMGFFFRGESYLLAMYFWVEGAVT